jgi:hypothetical protein
MGLGGQHDIPDALPWDNPSAHCRGRQGGHQVRSGRDRRIKIISSRWVPAKDFGKTMLRKKRGLCVYLKDMKKHPFIC